MKPNHRRRAGATILGLALGLAATFVYGPREMDARGGRAPSDRIQTGDSVVVFTNVSVLPMDSNRELRNQTVVVTGARISALGPATSVSIPAGARRIDGRGKFLMPGLAEMHAHVQGPQAANADEMNRDIMFLYIANGITTIRAMLGAPNQLILRNQLNSGEVLGPTMYVAAPSLNGNSAPTPETAARLVRAHKSAGYDLLKIHPGLNRPSYDAIVSTAREVGITWAGHVSTQVGVEHALSTKQSTIDHLDGYIEAAASPEIRSALSSQPSSVKPGDLYRSVTENRLRDLARQTKAAGTWNVPTMFLWESFFLPGNPLEWAKREEMRYAPKQWVTNWTSQKNQRASLDAQNGLSPADAALHIAMRRKMLKALADEGAPLLMGTDSPQMFNVPGFALHRELQVALQAGLTPYQILESGTRNVGRYVAQDLKQDGRFGTVSVGSRADLVLLDANPLTDLANLTRRAGVMLRGRWVSRSEIDKGLESLAAKYSN